MADDDQYNQDDSSSAKICKVYDKEDFFTVFVQLLLALFALLSLWFKRQNETPKRKFRTWFLDVSKQGLGACYAHVCNMVRWFVEWRNLVWPIYSFSCTLDYFNNDLGNCGNHY